MTNDNINEMGENTTPVTPAPSVSPVNDDTDARDEMRELDKMNGESMLSDSSREPEGDHESAESAPREKQQAPVSDQPIEVVGVRFKASGKIYYFSPCDTVYNNGDNVIVDTSRGIEYSTVCMPNRKISSSEIVPPIRKVLRLATKEDTERRRKNEQLEISAYNKFIEKIDEHGLEMKLIDVECAFDNSKLLFYFSAENRIDFRELVRELAGIFHTRIELRQIGIRDEAKMLGGLGICGRPFCCSSFLSDFVQVSIKMAKEQNLSLNSAKISGACGRLMCCLRYEYDTYLAEKALTPKVGAEVMTPDGEGVVSDANPMTGIVKVKLCGTAEDDAPAVFVREDLVLKADYKGEKLTKTPLPEKRNPVSLQASFEVRSPFSDLSKDRPAPAQVEHREPQASHGSDQGKRNDRKDRQKENSQNNGSNRKPEQPNGGEKSFQKQGNGGKHGKNRKNNHQGNQQQFPGNNSNKHQSAPNGQDRAGDGQKPRSANPTQGNQPQGNGGGKNRHRPFHRHGKPKNGGNNGGGNGGSNGNK